jgi:8-amino-7-oxononanoate synthase
MYLLRFFILPKRTKQMEFSANQFIKEALEKREAQNAFRRLTVNDQMIDFCSNDYLGFARSTQLKSMINDEFQSIRDFNNGSGGSRLLAGNTNYAEILESEIASFHSSEAGLIFNSGYDANVGLFSSIGQKGQIVIYDELIHASVHDGMKLSHASTFMFRHNDLAHLEERLIQTSGIVYVAVESIYSMDGDYAPLTEIVKLCKQYNAQLIVDEAHATGITLNGGKGRVQELGLEKDVFARVHTFGKALGCHGAIVLGSHLLRNYLINFARSFIYTTALPLHSLVAIKQSYQLLKKSESEILHLNSLISYFKQKCENASIECIESHSAIQCIVVSGNSEVKKIAKILQDSNFDIRPILNPTVAKGKERIRICIHVYNTKQEIDGVIQLLVKHLPTINS